MRLNVLCGASSWNVFEVLDFICLSRVFASGLKNAEALLVVFVLEALNYVLKSTIAIKHVHDLKCNIIPHAVCL